MKTMAYLHPTADHCVTTAPQGYDNPRKLVLRSDAEALMLMNASLQQQRNDQLADIRTLLDRLADSRSWLEDIRSEKLDGSEPELAKHLAEVGAVLMKWGR